MSRKENGTETWTRKDMDAIEHGDPIDIRSYIEKDRREWRLEIPRSRTSDK
jgi:hypothetical protein